MAENRKHIRRSFSKEQRAELYTAFDEYITRTHHPTVVGFASTDEVAKKHKINKTHINDWAEFEELRKRCNDKQEQYLLDRGMNGQSTAMAIFLLKQRNFGYRDKFEQDITTGGEKITFMNSVPRPEGKGSKKKT